MGVAWTDGGDPRLAVLTCSHLSSLDVRDGRHCDCTEPRYPAPPAEPLIGLLACVAVVVLVMALCVLAVGS